ncbi:MAG TPA: hypothetical protein VJ810_31065 [Blastocatellia bacterium]|nr:hypothetical protein [Blastocatellia bacterium]
MTITTKSFSARKFKGGNIEAASRNNSGGFSFTIWEVDEYEIAKTGYTTDTTV